MSSIRRTLEGSVRRDIALTCLAVLFIGLSYGAIAVASGLPLWLPIAQSVSWSRLLELLLSGPWPPAATRPPRRWPGLA